MSQTAVPPSDVPLELSKLRVEHTPCTAGNNSGRPDRDSVMYPLRVGVTMSMHKLTAGSGYDYLTRQGQPGEGSGSAACRRPVCPADGGSRESSRFRLAGRAHVEPTGRGSRAEGWSSGWGDCVMILATTALRISEVAGLQVGDVDLPHGLLTVRRQMYPGRGGLITKETKGRRRPVPIIEPLRATLDRLTVGRARDARLLVGPRGGVITTATLRDATGWGELVEDLGLAGLVRNGLRHTALTWMADAGVELHLLQRVAGHQDPAVTSRYLHPDHQAVLDVGVAYSRWWAQSGPNSPALRLVEDGPVAG
jgi:Phage integrase family